MIQRIARNPLLCFAWLGVVVFAVFLRFNDLSERPVHADEATGARILSQQLEGHGYSYNPRHFHGPLLAQMAYPFARLRGENDWQALNMLTLRSSTAIAGVLLVLTPLLWWRTLGHGSALAAAAFLATSPLLVFYSRVYIHETWLALFGMLAAAGVYSLVEKPSTRTALATGVAIGLMFATKITVAISILSWALAAAACLLLASPQKGIESIRRLLTTYWRTVLYLVIGALGSAAILYSNSLQNPTGILAALGSFFVYEPTSGHEKPFYDYFVQLVWPKASAGHWWTEGFVLIAALVAAWSLYRKDARYRTAICFLGLSTALHFLIYSAIAYKTLWLMLLPWAHLCLLAGCLVASAQLNKPLVRYALLILLLFGLAYQTKQSLAVTGARLENSSHHPYSYVPTSQDAKAIGKWLEALHAQQAFESLAVVGREYWPLPWYLKHLPLEIAYWPDATTDLSAYRALLVMPAQLSQVREQLQASHVELPRSLRANVPVFIFLHNERWDLWLQSDDE